MSSARQYRYYWGVMLIELMDKIGVAPSDRGNARLLLHWIFKKHFGIETTTNLPPALREKFFSQIRIVCNVELGIFLHEPNEENMEQMEMGEFLNIKMNET